MLEPREWMAAILIGVAIGAPMRALGAPDWAFVIALVLSAGGVLTYQRHVRERDLG